MQCEATVYISVVLMLYVILLFANITVECACSKLELIKTCIPQRYLMDI